MLKTPKGLNVAAAIRFVPRQVLLDSRTPRAANLDEREPMEGKLMADKTDKKKKKSGKKKELSETLTLDRYEGASSSQVDSRAFLLRSIAAYLEANGFARTVAALRSEAQIEIGDWKGPLPNVLEDVFHAFLVSSNDHADSRISWQKSEDLTKNSICVRNEENISNASQNILKKKKKKSECDDLKEAGELVLNNCDAHVDIRNKMVTDAVKSKVKKTKRSAPEDRPAENAEVSIDKGFIGVKELGEQIDNKNMKIDANSSNLSTNPENSHVETKEKKRKKKSTSDPLGEDAEKAQLEAITEKTDNGNHESKLPVCNVSTKDKKKRKHKVVSDTIEENIEASNPNVSEVNEKCEEQNKKKTKACALPLAETKLEIKTSEIKEKKKKREKSNLQTSPDLDHEVEEDAEKSGSAKENVTASEKMHDKSMKVSKKRKRLSSEGSGSQVDNTMATSGSTEVKLPGFLDNKEAGMVEKAEISSPDNGFHVFGKKRKTENDKENTNKFPTATSSEPSDVLVGHKENSCAGDSLKEVGTQLANGNLDKNFKEHTDSSKAINKERQSAESKKFNAFQRVKIDTIKYADERLQDNSYWAKDGADSGYGAKAQDVLGQVKGRDFRHEKTKKKRGSYRGGQIDLQSHSIKFSYSDEE